jgi:hypothetical protein
MTDLAALALGIALIYGAGVGRIRLFGQMPAFPAFC